MTKDSYKITKRDLMDLFGRLSESHRVIVPYKIGDRFHFADFDPKMEANIELGGIRQSQPIKSFINSAREKVKGGANNDRKHIVIAGVKGCDLSSLTLQDYVFLEGDYKDPFYMEKRDRSILIGSDCSAPKETCFCLAMDGAPYPVKHFDINISPIGDSFFVEVGTGKGRELISSYKTFFKDADTRDIDARQGNRDKAEEEIRGFINKRGTRNSSEIKGVVAKRYDDLDLWKDFSSTCVECGACNLGCPTCHCFLLFDQKEEKDAKRYRMWDSCLYNTFARVAGDANPRRHLYQRLRNRFDKKFEFFPQVQNYFGCTGCGRCIEACPGDIDIREVLKGLVLGKWTKPPHD